MGRKGERKPEEKQRIVEFLSHGPFTDQSQATLDGPDGWMSGWLLDGATPHSKIRRQQGGGGVIIWAGMINNQIVSPFRKPDVVKMCAESYVDFLKKNLFLGTRMP